MKHCLNATISEETYLIFKTKNYETFCRAIEFIKKIEGMDIKTWTEK